MTSAANTIRKKLATTFHARALGAFAFAFAFALTFALAFALTAGASAQTPTTSPTTTPPPSPVPPPSSVNSALPSGQLSVQQMPDTIILRGHGDVEHDIFIRDLLARHDYLLITRDTLISRADTVRSRVLVVGATLRLDGVIDGDLISIGGNVFIRPSASVTGVTKNIAGGLYVSDLAHMNASVENEPNAPYTVQYTPTSIDIVGTEHPSAFELPGIKGLSIPTYDRVNGVSLKISPVFVLPRAGRVEPSLRMWGSYYSQRGDFGGGGELDFKRRGTNVGFGAETDAVITNERWIRSDLSNSLAYLLQGHDYHNYYAADRGWVRIDRQLEQKGRTTTASLGGQIENATSLRAGTPWSFSKPDSVRVNDYGAAPDGSRRKPNGRITSAIATLDTKWQRPTFIVSLGGLAELGTSAFGGESSFARYITTGDLAMAALKHHTLEVEWHFQGPLPGTDSLPYQRWSFVGGSGTLQTFQTAAFSGDRVVAAETRYTIPLPTSLTLPLIGRPGFDLIHQVAMAWSHNEHRGFEQNVGFRLGYKIAFLRVMTDPRHFGDKNSVSVGLTFPRKSYPWEAPGPAPKQ